MLGTHKFFSLIELIRNLCLIKDELSPDTVVQADQNLRYVNYMIGPLTFPQLDNVSHIKIRSHISYKKYKKK